jgi:hypothetical protein
MAFAAAQTRLMLGEMAALGTTTTSTLVALMTPMISQQPKIAALVAEVPSLMMDQMTNLAFASTANSLMLMAIVALGTMIMLISVAVMTVGTSLQVKSAAHVVEALSIPLSTKRRIAATQEDLMLTETDVHGTVKTLANAETMTTKISSHQKNVAHVGEVLSKNPLRMTRRKMKNPMMAAKTLTRLMLMVIVALGTMITLISVVITTRTFSLHLRSAALATELLMTILLKTTKAVFASTLTKLMPGEMTAHGMPITLTVAVTLTTKISLHLKPVAYVAEVPSTTALKMTCGLTKTVFASTLTKLTPMVMDAPGTWITSNPVVTTITMTLQLSKIAALVPLELPVLMMEVKPASIQTKLILTVMDAPGTLITSITVVTTTPRTLRQTKTVAPAVETSSQILIVALILTGQTLTATLVRGTSGMSKAVVATTLTISLRMKIAVPVLSKRTSQASVLIWMISGTMTGTLRTRSTAISRKVKRLGLSVRSRSLTTRSPPSLSLQPPAQLL